MRYYLGIVLMGGPIAMCVVRASATPGSIPSGTYIIDFLEISIRELYKKKIAPVNSG